MRVVLVLGNVVQCDGSRRRRRLSVGNLRLEVAAPPAPFNSAILLRPPCIRVQFRGVAARWPEFAHRGGWVAAVWRVAVEHRDHLRASAEAGDAAS